ncbi:MAG: hypothetical protein K9N62_10190 [Verrucomicrobia bacterium]|nr:hypothetical protein [Verrucomicrobiota bacterium]
MKPTPPSTSSPGHFVRTLLIAMSCMATVACPSLLATEETTDPSLLTVERIFESSEFNGESFSARWLKDGSGYTRLEDSMIYPNRSHSISEGRNTTLHLRNLMTHYLLEKLPPEK